MSETQHDAPHARGANDPACPCDERALDTPPPQDHTSSHPRWLPPPPFFVRLISLIIVGLMTLYTYGRAAFISIHSAFSAFSALALVAQAWRFQRRRLLARSAAVLALLTLLAGPGSPLMNWTGVAYAQGATGAVGAGGHWAPDQGKPNRFNPKSDAASVIHAASAPKSPASTSTKVTPHPILHNTVSMKPSQLTLTPSTATTFLGSDGRFEVDVPAGAISSADVAAAGGAIRLNITEIAPGAGSSAGGSGLVSFGTYLVQAVDAQGILLSHGLRKPVQLVLHYGRRDSALDLTKVFVVLNGSLPTGVSVAPIGTQLTTPPPTGGRTAPGGINTPVYPSPVTSASISLGASSSQPTKLDLKGHRIVTTATLATPSSSMSWNTDSPVATFGKPDPFNVDLSAGGLTSSIPIDVPAGPGGLTPPVTLAYSSADVSEQHNVQGAAGWLGEGWNLSLGSITWAEHNVTADCPSTCTPTWEDSWQLSDPFGTAAELIPPNINVSTYWDDSPNSYCGTDGNANNSTSYPCPIQWHTAPETRAKVYAYIGNLTLPDGAGAHPPCFRVFLPNGIMEEFGCTADSLEYYYTPGMGDYISSWNIDLITDPRGNQIHITYDQDTEQKSFSNGTHTYIRDAVPSSIQWDSPGCLNAQTACTGSSWNPQMQVVFFPSHSPSHSPVINSPACNTGSNLRCDDPLDLSGSSGMAAPQVQSDFVLNDIEVQVRSSSTASWNVLDGYQFSYSESGPSTITDPATGMSESVAGSLLLTQVQKLGTNYGVSGTISLPPQTFTYGTQQQYYTDSAYHPNPSTNCGPSWNTGNGSGCLLWSQTYAGNNQYLATASNGQGLQTGFTWLNALNNTHGVNGGGGNAANPFYCYSSGVNGSVYPCDEATDQNWSHIVLSQQQSVVVRASSSGNQNVTSTTGYNYALTYPLNAQECSDCVAGMYWGNQNDGDYLDYYNGKFMGFAEADVTNPDGSVQKNKFYATNGYGIYDSSQVNCYSSFTCHNSPWWTPANALHGHAYEVDNYDTDGTTLLDKTTTQYQVTCPPAGVGGTPASTAWGNWNGNLVSELDHNDPVASCEIHTSQTDKYTYDGASSGPHVTTTYNYNLDSAGHDQWNSQVTTVNGGTNGSPTSSTSVQDFLWNDAVSATSTSATGTYIINVPYWTGVNDPSGYGKSCVSTSYDNGVWGMGQQNNLTYAEPTSKAVYTTACGTSQNNWVSTGPITTNTAYDSFGNAVGATDADANANISGHTGCTIGGSSYTACTAYDATYDAVPTAQTNVLNQTASTGYSQTSGGGYGLWPVSTTDANKQTTAYGYDQLGRMTSVTQPGETSGDTTTSWTYMDWCAATGAQTPCVEIDQTQRLNSTTTTTSRAFYDGWGQLVETRTPAPGGQDVVVYADYDPSGRKVFQSNPYFVAAYTGAPGSSAYATPDTTQSGTTTTYVNQRETQTQDPLSHTSTTTLSTQCGVGSDTGCYESATTIDPVGHQQVTLTDGLGRKAYDLTYTGSSSPYTAYAQTTYGYDYNGNLVMLTRPDGKNVTYTYDLTSRKTGMTDPDRGTETYAYDPNGNLIQTVDARGVSGTSYAGYDGLNRQIWRNATNSAAGAYATYTYDQASASNAGVGRLTSETFTNANAGGSLSGSYAYSYDGRGQVATTGETIGGVGACPSGWTCADIGSPALAGDQSALGNNSWLIRGAGGDIWGTSDQFHFMYQTQAGDGSLSAQVSNQQVTNTWAKAGVMLRATTDPGSPFYAVEVTPGQGISVQYRASQGASAVVQAGVSGTSPTYLQVTRSGATFSAATSTDGQTWTTISGSSITLSNLSGSLLAGVAVTSHNATAVSGAQVAHITNSVGGGAPNPSGVTPFTTSATYNDAGSVLAKTYPDGDVLSTSYDSASGWQSQLSLQQSGSSSAVPLLSGETYTGAAGAMGHMTSATLGAFSSGTGAYSGSYDALGRLTSASDTFTPSGGSAATLYQVQPTYDALSNVIGVTTTLPQGVDTQVFCYDDLSRLTWAGSTGTPSCSGAPTPSDTGSLSGTGATYSASYAYDNMNRLTSAPLGSYTYGDSTHADATTSIGSTWTASYDPAGNMICRAATSAATCAGSSPTGATMSYNNEGQLGQWQNAPSSPTSSASFLYDGEGNRVQQVATSSGSTTTTSYIGSLEEVATTGSNTTTTAYYGGTALSVNRALSYTLTDGLGSVSETVNSSGAVTTAQLYAPYGAVRYQSGTLPTNKGFTGQLADVVTGLDYYNARYYDPQAGQFTSADTTLTGGLNRYAYVGGNPETRTDPTGHRYALPTASRGGSCWRPCVGPVHHPTKPIPRPSIHQPLWASGYSIGAGAAGGALNGQAVWALKMAKTLNKPTVAVSGYTRANGTVVDPYMRRPQGAAAAAEEAETYGRDASALSWALVGIGFVIDGGVSGYSYYQSESAADPNRTEKAVIAGAMHASISTGISVGLALAVAAIPVVGESGVAEVAAGMIGAQFGGWVADQVVTPDHVDAVTSFVNFATANANTVSASVADVWGGIVG